MDLTRGRCDEAMVALGQPLDCCLLHGHRGLHHDEATNSDWTPGGGSSRSWAWGRWTLTRKDVA